MAEIIEFPKNEMVAQNEEAFFHNLNIMYNCMSEISSQARLSFAMLTGSVDENGKVTDNARKVVLDQLASICGDMSQLVEIFDTVMASFMQINVKSEDGKFHE